MKLLERYLMQVKRYLPYKDKDDTIKELRSIILDQVDEKSSSGMNEEDALYNIILEMGDPRDVADGYCETKPMISKEMGYIMKLVIKIVSITLPLAVLFANSISFVFGTEDFTFMDFFLNLAYNIPSAIYSLLVAIGFIFMIFYVIEHFFQPKFELEHKVFIPELLPDIPEKDFKVTLLGSIVTIIVTIIFMYLINFQQGLISVYYDGGRIPLLNSNFDKILPFMNIGWFITIILHIFYLYKRRKTIGSKSIEFLGKLYSGVILILLATSNIFNEVLIDGYDLNFIPRIFKIVFLILGIITIIASIFEYVKMFINLDNIEELEKKLDRIK